MASSTLGWTGLFGTISGANNREDLTDLITLTDPYETPFFSMVQKGTALHTLHEWQTEALQATATGGGAKFNEGGAFSASTVNDRTRLNNLCEIFRKDVQVSNTQRAVRPAGIKDEYLHQVQVAIKEIGRDIEVTLFQGVAGSATGTSASGIRTMKTIRNFLSTNAFTTTQTAVGATGVGFSTTAWSVGEIMFNNVLNQVFLSGGRVDTVFCNGPGKRQISRFAGAGAAIVQGSPVARRSVDQASKKLYASVDTYESDFGVVNIILDRFVGQRDIGSNLASTQGSSEFDGHNRMFFLQMDTWEIDYLRPLKHVPLPPGGDAVRGMVLSELTLSAFAEQWNAMLSSVSARVGATSDGTVQS